MVIANAESNEAVAETIPNDVTLIQSFSDREEGRAAPTATR